MATPVRCRAASEEYDSCMASHFANRTEAGRLLARVLRKFRNEKGLVVLALPRGGVVLGAEVARALRAPLDLVITRKIGHPIDPEYAICAITEDGALICDEAQREGIDPKWLEREISREMQEMQRRRKVYLRGREPFDVRGKTAIIVDDGIATGLTMRAAIQSIRSLGARTIVAAAPVCPQDTRAILSREADEVIILDDDSNFLGSVGMYYDDFPQVSDTEVIRILDSVHPDTQPFKNRGADAKE